ncbi:MAG TPA: methyltransferase domain-containing protein [Gemmataceae bacterium]|nr:methyltransferase domain-containing protein [Gemmataceae bacterium]
MIIDNWYLENLVCPRDHARLEVSAHSLACPFGHSYPVVDGVPVLLLEDIEQTLECVHSSIKYAHLHATGLTSEHGLFVESIGLTQNQQRQILALASTTHSQVDPAVSHLIGATNGIAYRQLEGKLKEYPIPALRLPQGRGKRLLDMGCNWGRWCIAAARKGYLPVGIDPSLGAIMAAKRVAGQMGLDIKFVVGDARHLPFPSSSFDVVFSYSVLQHFSKEDAAKAIAHAGRVLVDGGTSLIQMPTVFGVRCLYHQARRQFRPATDFEVRYWTVPALRRIFTASVGPSHIMVDCYFGIGLQPADWRFMPLHIKAAITLSELLRRTAQVLPPLTYLADSVYIRSVKIPTHECEDKGTALQTSCR